MCNSYRMKATRCLRQLPLSFAVAQMLHRTYRFYWHIYCNLQDKRHVKKIWETHHKQLNSKGDVMQSEFKSWWANGPHFQNGIVSHKKWPLNLEKNILLYKAKVRCIPYIIADNDIRMMTYNYTIIYLVYFKIVQPFTHAPDQHSIRWPFYRKFSCFYELCWQWKWLAPQANLF